MTTDKLKIIIFISGNVGGAERVSLTIAKLLPREKYEIIIGVIWKDEGNIKNFIPSDFKRVNIKIRNIYDFTVLKLALLMYSEKPDYVFSSLYYLNVRVILAAKLAGIHNIIIRNNISWNITSRINQILSKLTYRYATKIICQTDEMKDELQYVFPKLKNRIIRISNPIDIDSIKEKIKNDNGNPFHPDLFNYVYVGRISPEKDLETLIYAFSLVSRQIKNAHLTIVGDINGNVAYYKSLLPIISNLNLIDKITFSGFQSNPYKYMKHANCFVLPSKIEGNPNVLHEAMWLQVPVVVTNSIPLIRRIVTSDRGFVVEVGNENQLATSMINSSNLKILKSYIYEDSTIDLISLFK